MPSPADPGPRGARPLAAGDSFLSGPAARARARLWSAHAVSARPRPDRPLQGVPASQAQDPGVRAAERRPLPHAAHPHARGHAGLADRGARAAAQRGPRRGDRARSRPRSPAVRPHRRGGARPLPVRAVRRLVHAPRAVAARGRHARTRRSRAQPDVAGARRDRHPLGSRADSPPPSRARSSASSTASPTSTTTSTMRCVPA